MNEVIEKIEPRIYVGTYEKYNNGSIAGKWLDLNDYEDINAFIKLVKNFIRMKAIQNLCSRIGNIYPIQ